MASSSSYRELPLGTASTDVLQTLATGDFNGDGAGDILVWDPPALSTWLLKDTSIAATTTPTTNTSNLLGNGRPYVGDLDGDGISDITWTGVSAFAPPTFPPPPTKYLTQTWMMSAGTSAPRSVTTVSSTTDTVVGVGNFDGDSLHRADVLHRSTNGDVSIVLGGGGTVSLGNVASEWLVEGIGDFNGDQTSDILWYDVNSGWVGTWAMQNGTAVSMPVIGNVSPGSGWSIVGVGDVDHDGISDIVWRHTSGVLSIWMMTDPATVREYGPTLAIPTGATFAGVVELGPPATPTNLTVVSETLQAGRTYINVAFGAQRPGDFVEAWETPRGPGQKPILRQRVPYTVAVGSTMKASFDSSLFQGGAYACFSIRIWEQGRVSPKLSSQVCGTGLPPPAASLDWRVQPMFGLDADNDGAVDLIPSASALASLKAQVWPVTLDACRSTDPASGNLNQPAPTIANYLWTIQLPNSQDVMSSPQCQVSGVYLPRGSFPTTLTVTTQDGRTATVTRNLTVRNYLIVSMGDSYASGEGNPNNPLPERGLPVWGDAAATHCHRSAKSAPARAALALEQSDPYSSVTFLSTACTGAAIANLIDTPETDGGSGDGVGQNPQAQIQQVRNVLCPGGGSLGGSLGCPASAMPPIDALLLSISGNDVGFADIIKTCAEDPNPTDQHFCSNDPDFDAAEEAKLQAVPSRLAALNQAIGVLNVQHTYIDEYPDSVHVDSNDICYEIDLEGAVAGVVDATIDQADLTWAAGFIGRLDQSLQTFVSGTPGWSFVGGIQSAYITHGYCMPDHWVIHYDESFANQGDKYGTMHPNGEGQNGTATQILGALLANGIGGPNTAAFLPSP
jgi:hypothetical protein